MCCVCVALEVSSPHRSAMSMSLMVMITGLYKACVGWLARVMYGGPLHKAGARLLYFPSLARMSLLWSYLGRRNWYDRIDDTVVMGALPFRSQTKEVCVIAIVRHI